MSKNHIKDNVKYLRNKLSLTQGEFGALFGVSRDNIASYERGSEPRVEFIARVAKYFHITSDDFIGTRLSDLDDVLYDSASGYDLQVREPHEPYQANSPEVEKSSGWQNIPIYELDADTRLVSLFQEPQSFQPVDYLAASILPRCDGGVRFNGDSMAPVVKSGDIILYKQVNDLSSAIFWGEMYLLSFELDGDEYVMVKYIRQSDHPGSLKLVSHNPAHSPIEIAHSQLLALALVKMSIRINTLR